MFGDVWRWAGTWRRVETSIGVDPITIPMRLEQLLDDARYWVANTSFEPHEIAARLHHQMVLIHPFPNGNGRHTRLMADLLLMQLKHEAFSWGGSDLSAPDDTRTRYIGALRSADRGDLRPLLAFARS
jgi:Fic-DOC domain mobile mystery protein B